LDTSDFFKELGLGDPDMEKAREWVSYNQFKNSVPDILTLEEYIDMIYKKVQNTDARPHLWFSERYMISKYLTTKEPAEDSYVDNVLERIKKLSSSVPKESNFNHLHSFLDTLTDHISTKRTILPKEVLVYLNKLYKTKGLK
jgi:hypothetical protein